MCSSDLQVAVAGDRRGGGVGTLIRRPVSAVAGGSTDPSRSPGAVLNPSVSASAGTGSSGATLQVVVPSPVDRAAPVSEPKSRDS